MPRRRSHRIPVFKTSTRIEKLFFSADKSACLAKNVEMLSENPPVYIIRNFFSEGELNFFNMICTQYSKRFCKSFTEDDDNGRVCGVLRLVTSFFHFLGFRLYPRSVLQHIYFCPSVKTVLHDESSKKLQTL